MITTILWDVDGTLLDFGEAERRAMRKLFAEFDLGECTDDMLRRYAKINVSFWERLERGELTRDQVLRSRFEQFFGECGINPGIIPEYNRRYQLRLGDTAIPRDDSVELVRALRGQVKQYVVSNGTVAAQTRKLEKSGLRELMDGIFLSEELGAEKPSRAFFDRAFAVIRPGDLSQVLIVGDSLTSDMQGGINAGIHTCWYDPEGRPLPEEYAVDLVIRDLRELPAYLNRL